VDNGPKSAITQGKDAQLNPLKTVCIFCGSSDHINEPYLQAAKKMGHALADRGLTIIYGGGGTGMMGALADAALERGARVIGVIPENFNNPTLAHQKLSEMHVVKTMHERKAQMIAMSDAFIALPGGFGTFEELFEILTWAQIGLHTRPVGILNVNQYFNPLLTVIEHARSEGFIYNQHPNLLINRFDPYDLLDHLTSYNPPEGLERWVNRESDN
jgi:uncharacterized protein (TIGR00730 family)